MLSRDGLQRTRNISARLQALSNPEARRTLRGPALIPTAAGDPVTGAGAMALGPAGVEAVLSAEAARMLQARPGDRLIAHLERERAGALEHVTAPVIVRAVAPADRAGGIGVFTSPAFLDAVEGYLDGVGAAGPGWIAETLAQERRSYASFRLYAASLQAAPQLRDALEAAGVQVRTRADEIEFVLKLEDGLRWLFSVIAVVAGGGFWISLTVSLRGNVERLRAALSVFRLLGAGRLTRFLIPAVQSLTIVAAGAALALAAYLAIAWLVDWKAGG